MRNPLRDIAIIAFLIAATLSAYWPVRSNDFVYDDELYITRNPHTQAGLTAANVRWAFTTGETGNWHPLAWLSHMVDCQVFGTDPAQGIGPAGHHFANVAIHILNVILLFVLLRSMTREVWLSVFVAGLFALHPLHVESVAWVAERKDVLSTCFGLLAIWAYAGYARRPGIGRSMLVLLLFALSLMCKAMLVTLPFALLLLDYWPLRRIGVTALPADGVGGLKAPAIEGPGWSWPIAQRLILEKLPMIALSIVVSAAAFLVQQRAGALEWQLSLSARLANALVSYARYLGKTFWPADLAVLYPHPGHWPIWMVLASAGLLAIITITALATAKRHPYFIVGWLWFLGTLVPVIGLVQIGAQSMADRYTYVPLIGIFIALTWGAWSFLGSGRQIIVAASGVALLAALWFSLVQIGAQSMADRYTYVLIGLFIALTWGAWSFLGSGRQILVAASGVALLAALWFSTREQLRFWTNNEVLYSHALQVTGDENWVMHNNLGKALDDQATASRDKRTLVQAAGHFKKASEINPDSVDAEYNFGNAMYKLGEVDSARTLFARVLKKQPNHAMALNNFAWITATHPDGRLRNGPVAVQLAERLCDLTQHREPGALDTLAAAYAEAGRFEDALKTAQTAHDLAIAAHQDDLAREIQRHIDLFRTGKPIRQGVVADSPSTP